METNSKFHPIVLQQKYCSSSCRQEGLKAKNNLVCPCCGKAFHRKPSHIRSVKGNEGLFCSRECAKLGMSIRMSGKNNHQYGLKGFLNASFKGDEIKSKNNSVNDIMVYKPEHPFANQHGRVKKHRLIVEDYFIFFREDYFVVIDGSYYLRPDVDVHHIDGNHDNNDVRNLMVVTKSEHRRIHNKERVIIRDNVTGRIMGVVKRGELLENHTNNGNQQPSLSGNASEGSTTNSRDLLMVGNADTSALPLNEVKI